jgi:rubrerythrin
VSRLFENAIISIQLGVEDFSSNDPKRAVSAVRNFYAGVLLLAKETLTRAAPSADPSYLIAARYKPVSDGTGGVAFEPESQNTIDFSNIGKRFKDFNLEIDEAALRDLNNIRNNLEHFYTDKPREAVLEAVAKAFPVVVKLFEQIREQPRRHLGETWDLMLSTQKFYEAERQTCLRTFSNVQWLSGTIEDSGLICPACKSSLIRQEDPENEDQDAMELTCRACGATPAYQDAIVATLGKVLAGENYRRAKETGEAGPIYTCSECYNDAFVDYELSCAVCGHELGDVKCVRCGSDITVDELLHGDSTSLCGYCSYMAGKLMSE